VKWLTEPPGRGKKTDWRNVAKNNSSLKLPDSSCGQKKRRLGNPVRRATKDPISNRPKSRRPPTKKGEKKAAHQKTRIRGRDPVNDTPYKRRLKEEVSEERSAREGGVDVVWEKISGASLSGKALARNEGKI